MRAIVFPAISLLLTIGSCKTEEALAPRCPNAGALVKQVKNLSGVVYYDSTQSSYFIRVSNSFDSHDLGYTCNLTTDYQKPGLKVKFSGTYYQSDKQLGFVAGDKNYYLSLSSIQKQ
ncbi:hypothetical protein [Spirosoma validum]|uniref:hypothetical protein n=1 Tax=Spirosoma validum TaxID=2771355 RepID=UPI00168AA2A9|nr:hypothetical protein [Spirosoma validum]